MLTNIFAKNFDKFAYFLIKKKDKKLLYINNLINFNNLYFLIIIFYLYNYIKIKKNIIFLTINKNKRLFNNKNNFNILINT